MKELLPKIVMWDRIREASLPLAAALRPLSRDLTLVDSPERVFGSLASATPPDLVIADLTSLLSLEDRDLERLRPPVSAVPLAVATDRRPEEYISEVRRLLLYHVLVKTGPFDRHELSITVDSALDPARGFGLVLHFDQTLEMYAVTATTRDSKNEAVERVINYFATNGFEIHELYDVRLILEELVNNAFFHAFRNKDGTEKYHLSDFKGLDVDEVVRIDFGNAGDVVGFAVTDNAGTLQPDDVLSKMERQYKKQGLFDESGRGLYISRMLASTLFFNIEQGYRTQVVATFRGGDRKTRMKSLVINFSEAPACRLTSTGRTAAAMTPLPAPPSAKAPSQEFSPSDLHEDFD